MVKFIRHTGRTQLTMMQDLYFIGLISIGIMIIIIENKTELRRGVGWQTVRHFLLPTGQADIPQKTAVFVDILQ